MQRVMPATDDESQIGERARLAELIQIMGRHGLNGLALRLGLLPLMNDASARADVHAFVEAMQALGPGLKLLSEQAPHAADASGGPAWHALCFTASGTDSAFVSDLFVRWIPEDQGLARSQP